MDSIKLWILRSCRSHGEPGGRENKTWKRSVRTGGEAWRSGAEDAPFAGRTEAVLFKGGAEVVPFKGRAKVTPFAGRTK